MARALLARDIHDAELDESELVAARETIRWINQQIAIDRRRRVPRGKYRR
jgi:formate dehydrogenase maturation protein FdhE